MRIVMLLVAMMLGAGGCVAASPSVVSSSPTPSCERPRLTRSLFPGDTQMLGNAAIEEVLSRRVGLPDHARLGVVALASQDPWQGESQRLVTMNREALDGFASELRRAKKVDDILLVPSLLIPEKVTIPALREMAARCQADMVFVYTAQYQTYRKSKLWADDEIRGYCQIEGILLDTRTGIVAKTVCMTHDYAVKELKEDLDYWDTMRRSQIEATTAALGEIAKTLTVFLDACGS